jgi:hypothetical protein
MRNRSAGLLLLIIGAVALSVALAQTQNRPKSTWPFGGPEGTFYKGVASQTVVIERDRSRGEQDEGGYHLLPAPDSDRNKPYEKRAMNGVWELIAASDSTETVSSYVPPMTAKGKAMFAETRPGAGPRASGRDQNDPDPNCDPVGWPRIIYQPIRPVEFFTLRDRQLQHWAWRDQWRTIWTDGRLLPTHPDPLWYGYSVGRWESDNAFHEVTHGEDDRTWLSRYGNIHSINMIVDATWRRRDHNTLTLDITLKDPAIYTKDWVGETAYFQYLPGSPEVDPLPCAGSEELFYLNQMRSNYPSEENLRTKAPKEPTAIVPPVRAPNTGVGLSK